MTMRLRTVSMGLLLLIFVVQFVFNTSIRDPDYSGNLEREVYGECRPNQASFCLTKTIFSRLNWRDVRWRQLPELLMLTSLEILLVAALGTVFAIITWSLMAEGTAQRNRLVVARSELEVTLNPASPNRVDADVPENMKLILLERNFFARRYQEVRNENKLIRSTLNDYKENFLNESFAKHRLQRDLRVCQDAYDAIAVWVNHDAMNSSILMIDNEKLRIDLTAAHAKIVALKHECQNRAEEHLELARSTSKFVDTT